MNQTLTVMEVEARETRAIQVWVFKTSVQHLEEVTNLASSLDSLVNGGRWNFDLEDCDKILRIESGTDIRKNAIDLLESLGYHCEELED